MQTFFAFILTQPNITIHTSDTTSCDARRMCIVFGGLRTGTKPTSLQELQIEENSHILRKFHINAILTTFVPCADRYTSYTKRSSRAWQSRKHKEFPNFVHNHQQIRYDTNIIIRNLEKKRRKVENALITKIILFHVFIVVLPANLKLSSYCRLSHCSREDHFSLLEPTNSQRELYLSEIKTLLLVLKTSEKCLQMPLLRVFRLKKEHKTEFGLQP